MERVEGKEVVVTAGRDRNQRSVRLDVGDRVEMIWKGAGELRALPTRLVAVEGSGSGACWRLVATGPAGRGQRRSAVRAVLTLPVRAAKDGTTLAGTTLDIVVQLGPGQPAAQVDAVRVHRREDECSELSVRFVGLSEKDQDAIRARVFAGLRDLRQRGLL